MVKIMQKNGSTNFLRSEPIIGKTFADPHLVCEYVKEDLIKKQTNEDERLVVLSYTNKVQYDRAWDEVTRTCRGLILDRQDYSVLARPFPKFFNYGEMVQFNHDIPDSQPSVYEKADGSLGILYYYDGRYRIATRGSFSSEQAERANQWIANQDIQENIAEHDNFRYTYLFEIIYPENRVVVDYGDTEELVLLGRVNKFTGEVQMPDQFEFATGFAEVGRLRQWEQKGIEAMQEHDEKHREGFVLHWPDNTMAKIKLETYKRWHRVFTELNKREVWRYAKGDREDLENLLKGVPDEFYNQIHEFIGNLQQQFDEKYAEAIEVAEEAQDKFGEDMKEIAFWLEDYEFETANKHMVFMIVKEKWDRLKKIIWKQLKPKGEKIIQVN